jgi:hypothetical protein
MFYQVENHCFKGSITLFDDQVNSVQVCQYNLCVQTLFFYYSNKRNRFKRIAVTRQQDFRINNIANT